MDRFVYLQNRVRDRWIWLARSFPNAKIPEKYCDCFALKDGRCRALTHEWCKYEKCGFYKPGEVKA